MTLDDWRSDWDNGHYAIVIGLNKDVLLFEDPVQRCNPAIAAFDLLGIGAEPALLIGNHPLDLGGAAVGGGQPGQVGNSEQCRQCCPHRADDRQRERAVRTHRRQLRDATVRPGARRLLHARLSLHRRGTGRCPARSGSRERCPGLTAPADPARQGHPERAGAGALAAGLRHDRGQPDGGRQPDAGKHGQQRLDRPVYRCGGRLSAWHSAVVRRRPSCSIRASHAPSPPASHQPPRGCSRRPRSSRTPRRRRTSRDQPAGSRCAVGTRLAPGSWTSARSVSASTAPRVWSR